MRVTVPVHEDLARAAGLVHFLLGKADHDQTYQYIRWQDQEGAHYAMSSGEWTKAQITGVQQVASAVAAGFPVKTVIEGFERYPAFFAAYGDEGVAAVGQAASVFSFWADGDEISELDPMRIVAMQWPRASDVHGWLGLTQIPVPDE